VTRIKYGIDVMRFMSIFESLTGAKLKDCILDEKITFIVQENEMGKAIGKKGANIKRIGEVLKKEVKLVEFNSDAAKFVSNLIYPLHAKEIKEEDNIINIYVDDRKTKGLLIGRNKKRINSVDDIVKRYFDVIEVRVC